MKPWSTEQLLEDVHKSIKALINSTTALRENFAPWLTKCMAYDLEEPIPWHEREAWFEAMGVDVETMKSMQEVKPRWDAPSQALYVSKALRDDPEGFKKVEALLLYAHAWINFSDGRFGAIGKSGRRYNVSRALGLDGLFYYCEEEGKLSKYYSNPYHKAQQEGVRQWLALASLSFYPVESNVLELLEDDRFYLRKEELWDELITETKYITGLPDTVWRQLCVAAGLDKAGVDAESSESESVSSGDSEEANALHTSGCISDKASRESIVRRRWGGHDERHFPGAGIGSHARCKQFLLQGGM